MKKILQLMSLLIVASMMIGFGMDTGKLDAYDQKAADEAAQIMKKHKSAIQICTASREPAQCYRDRNSQNADLQNDIFRASLLLKMAKARDTEVKKGMPDSYYENLMKEEEQYAISKLGVVNCNDHSGTVFHTKQQCLNTKIYDNGVQENK